MLGIKGIAVLIGWWLAFSCAPASPRDSTFQLSFGRRNNPGQALVAQLDVRDSVESHPCLTISSTNAQSSLRLGVAHSVDTTKTPWDISTEVGRYQLTRPSSTHEFFVRGDGCLEWLITLHSRPVSNVFTFPLKLQNVVCYYQDTLTEYEITVMQAVRPDSVIGSYAVYCVSDRPGRPPAIADKLTHIYRPRAWCGGDTVWCDLAVTDSTLSVFVPPSFLESANYARGVVIDPAFGHPSTPASEANMPFEARALVSGSLVAGDHYFVTEVASHSRVYMGSVTHDLGLYDMPSESIEGGRLVGGVQHLDVSNTAARQWNTVSGLNIELTEGTEYCIAMGNQTGNVRIGYDLGASGEYHASHYGSMILPEVWEEAASSRYIYGIRATYVIDSPDNSTARRRVILGD